MKYKIQVAAAIAGRLDGLMMPLQEPLRVCEAAVLLCMCSCREEEYFSRDFLCPDLAALDLRCLAPELRGLGHRKIAHHQPVKLSQSLVFECAVHRTDDRVLAH